MRCSATASRQLILHYGVGLRRRCATLQNAPPAVKDARADVADSHLKPQQREFLAAFRAKLAEADGGEGELDSFVGGMPAEGDGPRLREPSLSMEVPRVPLVKRGVEPLPSWLKTQVAKGPNRRPKYNKLMRVMKEKGLATVCQEAKCPNIGECWGGGDDDDGVATATIMMMGDTCTRGCRFCAVKTSRVPPPLDPQEPSKVAAAVAGMGIEYIVITMVDRDDLSDGGAAHVANTLQAVKKETPSILLEVLAGDFHGNLDHTTTVATCGVDCYAHNIECVERVTPRVRDRRANYRQSLGVLEHAKRVCPALVTKSSIMLGVGEEEHEIRQTLRDLRTAGVDAVTLGQYLQPSASRMKVSRYAHPLEFEKWEAEAKALGFLYCASGPMVRSSYRAGEYFMANVVRGRKLTSSQNRDNATTAS